MPAALPSQRGGVVGGKQPAAPPQPPFPPGGVGAVQHLDDVADAEAQLVVLLRREVVQRPHLECGRPLWGKQKRERIKTLQLGDAAKVLSELLRWKTINLHLLSILLLK